MEHEPTPFDYLEALDEQIRQLVAEKAERDMLLQELIEERVVVRQYINE
jgi:hypothetical protein